MILDYPDDKAEISIARNHYGFADNETKICIKQKSGNFNLRHCRRCEYVIRDEDADVSEKLGLLFHRRCTALKNDPEKPVFCKECEHVILCGDKPMCTLDKFTSKTITAYEEKITYGDIAHINKYNNCVYFK